MSAGFTVGRIGKCTIIFQNKLKAVVCAIASFNNTWAHFDLPKTVQLLAIDEPGNNYGFNAIKGGIDAGSMWWRCKRCNLLINLRGNTFAERTRRTTNNAYEFKQRFDKTEWLDCERMNCVLLPIFCSLCWFACVLAFMAVRCECCQRLFASVIAAPNIGFFTKHVQY